MVRLRVLHVQKHTHKKSGRNASPREKTVEKDQEEKGTM